MTCAHCGRAIPAEGLTAHDHCPYCLWSVHLACGSALVPGRRWQDENNIQLCEWTCAECGESYTGPVMFVPDKPVTHHRGLRN